MKSFQDLGQQNNPGARASLGIALFQDMLVILVFLVMPALYHDGDGGVGWQIGVSMLKGVAFLAGAWLLGRYGLTPLLHAVARTRSRELFTLTVIGLCAGVAFAGGALDLSLALGAFAAGLVVSESIYSHRILSDILPFKDLFLAIFFVSVGLLIDLSVVAAEWPRVLLGSLLILGVEGRYRVRGAERFQAAGTRGDAGGGQSGQHGRVFAGAHRQGGRLPAVRSRHRADAAGVHGGDDGGGAVVDAGGGAVCPLAGTQRDLGDAQAPPAALAPTKVIKEIRDHAIICGYGPVGRALNEALKRCGVATLVLELNSDTVRALKRAGQPVLFADATHPEALDLAGIARARLVAFTFPAVTATCAAVPLVRERNPGIYIFGRAKYPNEVSRLRELDVQVIHDERESAVAMVRAAISSYERPDIDPEEVVRESMGDAP